MKLHRYLLVVPVVIVLLAACTDKGLDPIFYTLETERSLSEDRGLEDDIGVHRVVKAGTWYFAAANALYRRSETGNWSRISPPVSGALCNTIEEYGGLLYAGFYTRGGTLLGLYRTDPDTISWDNSVFDAEVQDIQIGLIKSVGGNLYVVTAQTSGAENAYYLYESPDGTSYTGNDVTFDAVSPITLPILDVEEDGTPNIWVIAGESLYLESGVRAVTLQNAVGDPVVDGGKTFGGLLYSSSLSRLYLSGQDGKLWIRDGTTWSSGSVADDPAFTRFVDLAPVGANDIFVGTQGTGYYELAGGDITTAVRRPDYDISALYRGAINSFFLDTDPDPDVLFACTSGAGLWRANWDSVDSEWIWVQE
jgi:hypothetical protein